MRNAELLAQTVYLLISLHGDRFPVMRPKIGHHQAKCISIHQMVCSGECRLSKKDAMQEEDQKLRSIQVAL